LLLRAARATVRRLGIWFKRVREWGTDAGISEDTAATDCLLARQVCLVLISCSGLHGRMTRCGWWAYTLLTAQTHSDSIRTRYLSRYWV